MAYDDFSYPVGTQLFGLNGGGGWSGAWENTGGISGDAYTPTIVPGLSYEDLETSGNAFEPTPLGSICSRPFNTVFQPPFGQVQTLWFSVLVKPIAAPTNQGFTGITIGAEFGFAPYSQSLGTTYYGIFGGGGYGPPAPILSNAQVVIGQTAFLVGEITFGGSSLFDDIATLYVDPTPGLASPDVSGVTSVYNYGLSSVSGSTIETGDPSGPANPVVYDEIRYGTTYSDVAPVPEPASLVLSAAALLMLSSPSRRRRPTPIR